MRCPWYRGPRLGSPLLSLTVPFDFIICYILCDEPAHVHGHSKSPPVCVHVLLTRRSLDRDQPAPRADTREEGQQEAIKVSTESPALTLHGSLKKIATRPSPPFHPTPPPSSIIFRHLILYDLKCEFRVEIALFSARHIAARIYLLNASIAL